MLLKSKTLITSLFILLIWFPSAAALSVKDQYQQYSEVKTALDELVLANHILYDQGALDGSVILAYATQVTHKHSLSPVASRLRW